MNVKDLINELECYDEDLEIVLLTKPWRGLGSTYDFDDTRMEVGISIGRGRLKDKDDVCCDYQEWVCPCGNQSIIEEHGEEVCEECGMHIGDFIPKEGSCSKPSHNTNVLAIIIQEG